MKEIYFSIKKNKKFFQRKKNIKLKSIIILINLNREIKYFIFHFFPIMNEKLIYHNFIFFYFIIYLNKDELFFKNGLF
jgi:hypothetical protein